MQDFCNVLRDGVALTEQKDNEVEIGPERQKKLCNECILLL